MNILLKVSKRARVITERQVIFIIKSSLQIKNKMIKEKHIFSKLPWLICAKP